MPSISRTTSWAGPSSWPAPSREPPTSLTTTLAPSDAIIRACSRPMPRPAPVTIATLPSHMFPMGAWDSREAADRATRPPPRRSLASVGARSHTLSHVAVSVPPGTITESYRTAVLDFYGRMLGWREIEQLRRPDRITIAVGPACYLNLRERDDAATYRG